MKGDEKNMNKVWKVQADSLWKDIKSQRPALPRIAPRSISTPLLTREH